MKIYFGASITFSRKLLPVYQKIVKVIIKHGHEIISEYVVDSKLKVGDGLTANKLFEREIAAIEKADLMIAEVTVPSWGTAFLMEHALKKNKPVLALYYKSNHAKISLMIQGHPELYLASYDDDNLKTVLEFNLKHFGLRQKSKGKLIVIDGTNGSGKATQTKLLLQYLKKNKIKAKRISFPRYYTSFHGETVARFLTGEFGKLEQVSPYLSSLAFALDRLTAKNQIIDWLSFGNLVIADRYITSSLAHQGVKLPSKEREKFVNWLYDMEYKQHQMPKENIVIYLYVPPEISDQLILKKEKKYRHKQKRDIEENLKIQRKTSQFYLELCKKYKHWVMIKCVDEQGKLKSKKEVHREIIKALKEKRIVV